MPQNPRPRGNDDDGSAGSNADGKQRLPRSTYLLWAVGAAALVAFVVLHLTGVFGPGAHG